MGPYVGHWAACGHACGLHLRPISEMFIRLCCLWSEYLWSMQSGLACLSECCWNWKLRCWTELGWRWANGKLDKFVPCFFILVKSKHQASAYSSCTTPIITSARSGPHVSMHVGSIWNPHLQYCPCGSNVGPTWDRSWIYIWAGPSGTNVGPRDKTHMGPSWAYSLGPHRAHVGPRWASWLGISRKAQPML